MVNQTLGRDQRLTRDDRASSESVRKRAREAHRGTPRLGSRAPGVVPKGLPPPPPSRTCSCGRGGRSNNLKLSPRGRGPGRLNQEGGAEGEVGGTGGAPWQRSRPKGFGGDSGPAHTGPSLRAAPVLIRCVPQARAPEALLSSPESAHPAARPRGAPFQGRARSVFRPGNSAPPRHLQGLPWGAGVSAPHHVRARGQGRVPAPLPVRPGNEDGGSPGLPESQGWGGQSASLQDGPAHPAPAKCLALNPIFKK